jgi:hypothetical protein
VLCAAIEQLDLAAAHGLNGHALEVGFGRDRELRAVAERVHFVVTIGDGSRAVRLARERAELAADFEGLSKQDAREELEVEAHLSNPGCGQGLVEVDDDQEGASIRLHLEHVAKVKVGIGDRVEPLAVVGRIRIGHVDRNLLNGAVDPARTDSGLRLPLAGSGLKAKVAVCCDAEAVLDYSHPPLVPLGIEIVREHDVEAGHLEVFLIVDRKGIVRRPHV